jgi:hypothetical protein
VSGLLAVAGFEVANSGNTGMCEVEGILLNPLLRRTLYMEWSFNDSHSKWLNMGKENQLSGLFNSSCNEVGKNTLFSYHP